MYPANRIDALLFMASEKKAESERLHVAALIREDTFEALHDFSDATGKGLDWIVEEALRRYLRSQYWIDGKEPLR